MVIRSRPDNNMPKGSTSDDLPVGDKQRMGTETTTCAAQEREYCSVVNTSRLQSVPAYSPANLGTLGFSPVPIAADNPKALAYTDDGTRVYHDRDWREGMGTAIRLGLQTDGTYLCRLDLDQHRPDQNARAALDLILEHSARFQDKMYIAQSTKGLGYDILLRSPRPFPNNQRIYVAGVHAGESFCEGGRMSISGHAISGSLETLAVLTLKELETLLGVVTVQWGSRNPVSWTARYREVLPLLRGYTEIDTTPLRCPDGMPKIFVGSARKHLIAQDNYRRVKTATKGTRSEAHAANIQSLMLLADRSFGSTIIDKCRTVAALAVEDCPKRGEKWYNVERDTAALIARILHGDPQYGGRHFLIPYWASGYHPPARPPHRASGTQLAQLERLRRVLLQHAEGDRVERLLLRHRSSKLTVAALARLLQVAARTMQRYLAILEEGHEIKRDKRGGRGSGLTILILPAFGHAPRRHTSNRHQTATTKDAKKCPTKATETVHKV